MFVKMGTDSRVGIDLGGGEANYLIVVDLHQLFTIVFSGTLPSTKPGLGSSGLR